MRKASLPIRAASIKPAIYYADEAQQKAAEMSVAPIAKKIRSGADCSENYSGDPVLHGGGLPPEILPEKQRAL